MKGTDRAGRGGFTLSELLMVFVIVTIIMVLMMPFIRRSMERTENILCANNLRDMGLALYIYAKEHNGNFPPALKALYDEQYLADEKIMDCPASVSVGIPASPDYIYTSGVSVRSPSLDVFVRDKAKNHPQKGKNVLYVSGAVAWEQ